MRFLLSWWRRILSLVHAVSQIQILVILLRLRLLGRVLLHHLRFDAELLILLVVPCEGPVTLGRQVHIVRGLGLLNLLKVCLAASAEALRSYKASVR